MDRHNITAGATSWDNSSIINDYAERIAYDANGNIQTYQRNQAISSGNPQGAMDNLTYNYNRDASGMLLNNKLRHINDAVPSFSTDIHDQTPDNYTYDAIGNLVADQQEHIGRIKWNIYGKITDIEQSQANGSPGSTSSIQYQYDPSGNRISKIVSTQAAGAISPTTNTTWYARDAQGNVLGVYTYNQGGSPPPSGNGLTWSEQHLYGSSRLGMLKPGFAMPTGSSEAYVPGGDQVEFAGNHVYEISNHLGNVLATISDLKVGLFVQTGSGFTFDHYQATVLSAQDYYPFGMPMPGRTFNGVGYRYGFNGKENDNEVKGIGDQIDYGMRAYDPRVGRFMSMDPLAGKYPKLTPYQYAGNKPVWKVDIDGLEPDGEDEPAKTDATVETDLERGTREYKESVKERDEKEAEEERKKDEESEKNDPTGRARRALDALKITFQNINKNISNYAKNGFKATEGTFADPVIWQVHEENVYLDLVKNNPQGQFGKQITLDVYNKNGEMETIVSDLVSKMPNSQTYQLIEIKFSGVKDLTISKASFTESQQAAYEWIKTGQAAAIVPRGGNASQLNLAPGVPIKVSSQIKIAVNIPQTAQNQAQYGTKGILYSNY